MVEMFEVMSVVRGRKSCAGVGETDRLSQKSGGRYELVPALTLL